MFVVIAGTLTLFIYVGIFIWLIGFITLSLWAIYRIGKGWMRLSKGTPAYALS
jgi:uncharacterized membrane protein